MRVVPLSVEESARTGFTHVAHLKGSNGDLDTAESLNIIALSTNCYIERVALDVVASLGGTASIGIAASASSGTDFINAATATATVAIVAPNGMSAVYGKVNSTASRFLTITAGTGAAAAECYVWFRYTDFSQLRIPILP